MYTIMHPALLIYKTYDRMHTRLKNPSLVSPKTFSLYIVVSSHVGVGPRVIPETDDTIPFMTDRHFFSGIVSN